MHVLTTQGRFCLVMYVPVCLSVCRYVRGRWDARSAGINTEIVVTRLKNRFHDPTPDNWADCMINFRIPPNGTTCEVQIQHKRMTVQRQRCGAHKVCVSIRATSQGCCCFVFPCFCVRDSM